MAEAVRKEKESDDLYGMFCSLSPKRLEEALLAAETREEKAFYRVLLNLKLQIEQEKIVGEDLL